MTEVTLDVLPGHRARPGRGAHRAQPRARGRRRPAGGVGDRVPRRRTPPRELQQLFMTPQLPRVHEPRHRRLRDRRRAEERDRDRGGHRRRPRLRRQHAGRARSRVASPSSPGSASRSGGEPLTFAGLAGLGDLVATVHEREEPQPQRGLRARPGPAARRDRGRDEHGGRGRAEHRGGARARAPSAGWRCRSPRWWARCSTRVAARPISSPSSCCARRSPSCTASR